MPYIYKITNKINNKLYIGKTSLSLEKRFKEHCRDSVRFYNRPLYAAMRKYGCNNFFIEEIEYCMEDAMACEREQYWINFYKTYHYGYNASLGGYGRRIYDYKIIYEYWLNNKNCSQTAKELGIDCYTVSKAVKEFGEQPYCKKGFAVNEKMVDMLTLGGEYIRTFNSLREAAKVIAQELNKSIDNVGGYSSHIASVCKGTRKSCLGYKWRYHK